MKKIRLIAALFLLNSAAFSQNCPDIILGDIYQTGPGTYNLIAMYTAMGQNQIVDSIYCGTTLISAECVSVTGPGVITKTITCTGGAPSAILNIGTGECGSSTLCNRIFICPTCGPLPVTMSEFVVQRKNNAVVLNWKTQTEINSSHFDVYRSLDNISYEKIGSVASISSNSNIVHNYAFTDDHNTSTFVSYYKLKIVDVDDRFTYSDIKTVKGRNSGIADFTIYPNPAASNSSVTFSGISEPTLVEIVDNSGRILKSVTLSSSNSMELSGIQRGNYILMIKGKASGQTAVKKLTVVN